MCQNCITILSDVGLIELEVTEAKNVNISELNNYLNTFLGLTALVIVTVNILVIRSEWINIEQAWIIVIYLLTNLTRQDH